MRWAVVGALVRKELIEGARRGPMGRTMNGGYYMAVVVLHLLGALMAAFVGWQSISGLHDEQQQIPALAALWFGHVMWIGYGNTAIVAAASEAFVGERERRTLRMLLSMPATDREILAGKAGFALTLSIMGGVLAAALWSLVAPLFIAGLTLEQVVGAAFLSVAIALGVTLATMPAGFVASSRAKNLRAAQWRSSWAPFLTIGIAMIVLMAGVAGGLGAIHSFVVTYTFPLAFAGVVLWVAGIAWLTQVHRVLTRPRLMEVGDR